MKIEAISILGIIGKMNSNLFENANDTSNVMVVMLDGASDFGLQSVDVARVIVPLHGYGVDVAYTLSGSKQTSVKFLNGSESATVEGLFLPVGSQAMLRGEGCIAVVESADESSLLGQGSKLDEANCSRLV